MHRNVIPCIVFVINPNICSILHLIFDFSLLLAFYSLFRIFRFCSFREYCCQFPHFCTYCQHIIPYLSHPKVQCIPDCRVPTHQLLRTLLSVCCLHRILHDSCNLNAIRYFSLPNVHQCPSGLISSHFQGFAIPPVSRLF